MLAFVVGAALLIDVVPKQSQLTKIVPGLRARILRFAQKTGRAPESLAALAVSDPPSAQFIADPWGRDIQYAVSPDGVVTLTSLSGYATIGDATNNDTIRVWRFGLRDPKSASNGSVLEDAEEGWIGNDRWGKQKTAITQSK